MHGVDRNLASKILKLLEYFPAVALLGPRQCGKTTLAHDIQECWHLPTTYLDLENVADLAKIEDAVGYLKPLENQLVILDEVHQRPGLFPEIRGLIDEGKRNGVKNGRFLFLGSASFELLRQSGESLAGRIAFLELTPFLSNEVGGDANDHLWTRGGFPDSFLAPNEMFSREWRRNFIDTYLTRDLSVYGKAQALPAIRALLQMTAHLHGQVLNVAQLVKSHDFSRQQITSYLDLFEQTFVIRRLNPYFKNSGKRLTKRPKLYIRDSGILHQLLNIPDLDSLHGHPTKGASWEGFVIEQVIAMLSDWQPYFYRTSNGAELDLLMQKGDKILAFEIKASVAAKLTKGFHTACSDIEPTKVFVISRADASWQNQGGVHFTNLKDLPESLAEFRE